WLLPMFLSRVVRVRVARLPDSIVAAFAQRELGETGQRELAQRVALADGRIGRLLADGAGRARGAEAAERFLAAVEAGPVRRYEVALGLQPFQARGRFPDMLAGLLEQPREPAPCLRWLQADHHLVPAHRPCWTAFSCNGVSK